MKPELVLGGVNIQSQTLWAQVPNNGVLGTFVTVSIAKFFGKYTMTEYLDP